MENCNKDIAQVDNSQLECCGIYPTNCISASQADLFLKIKKGDTGTSIISKISDWIKKLNGYIPFYEYNAVLNQTSINAPTKTAISTTINAVDTYTYISTGLYNLHFNSPILDPIKAFVFVSNPTPTSSQVEYSITDANNLLITTYDVSTGSPADGLLQNVSLQIKIKR